MATRYIHIGYPKNLSTALQRGFFEPHPQLLHLGIGIGSNVDYIDAHISRICENDLIYAKDFYYSRRQKENKRHFENWFAKAENDSEKRAVGISLELLSFSFTPDMRDVTTKAKRVAELFEGDAKIIAIIRSQEALFRSLYRESVRLGYPGSYQQFAESAWLMQDRNFLSDFCYDRMYELYAQHFGRDNLLFLPIEEVRAANGELVKNGDRLLLIEKVAHFLGVDYLQHELPRQNDPLTDAVLIEKRELNARVRHEIGNDLLGRGANFHRIKHHITDVLGWPWDEKFIHRDVIHKRQTIAWAEQLAGNAKVDYTLPDMLRQKLAQFYGESNRRFQKISGVKISDAYHTVFSG